MRNDIRQLIEDRPSWKFLNDQQYQDILSAIEYARTHNNYTALQELELMLETRQRELMK